MYLKILHPESLNYTSAFPKKYLPCLNKACPYTCTHLFCLLAFKAAWSNFESNFMYIVKR